MTQTTMTTCAQPLTLMRMMGIAMVVVATVCLPPQVVSSTPPTAQAASKDGRCQHGLPPPDLPFRVVWNHPDTCERHNLSLHLDRYGFIFNRRREFLGEEIQTLYDRYTGPWPYISDTGDYVNGGLPQLFKDADLNKTWELLSQRQIANFAGLAIIDFEEWRAIFTTNYGKMRRYKAKAVEHVRQDHPDYSHKQLEAEAERQWEGAARRIFSAKLTIAQKLMPRGHWGFFEYPRAWGPKSNTPQRNNKIDWFWRQATGLYPRIYMFDPNETTSAKVYYVSSNIKEAVRVQSTLSPPNTPIYPFSNPQQDNILFDEDHLKITLELPAMMGASGVVLWGSSSYYKHPQSQCGRLQEYLHTVLGPLVHNLTQALADCSTALCGGHGRCVHNSHDTLISKAESKRLSGLCTPRDSNFRDYHCRCYTPWEGACCQTHNPSLCPDPHGTDDHANATIIG